MQNFNNLFVAYIAVAMGGSFFLLLNEKIWSRVKEYCDEKRGDFVNSIDAVKKYCAKCKNSCEKCKEQKLRRYPCCEACDENCHRCKVKCDSCISSNICKKSQCVFKNPSCFYCFRKPYKNTPEDNYRAYAESEKIIKIYEDFILGTAVLFLIISGVVNIIMASMAVFCYAICHFCNDAVAELASIIKPVFLFWVMLPFLFNTIILSIFIYKYTTFRVGTWRIFSRSYCSFARKDAYEKVKEKRKQPPEKIIKL